MNKMNRVHRIAALAAAAAFALAACAPAGGGSSGGPATSPGSVSASAAPSPSDEVASRVSIDDVLVDPAAFQDADVTIMENVDEVYVVDRAFRFSGTEVQGDLLVVVAPDATIDKEIQPDRVVTVTGRIVPFTDEAMQAAGIDLTADDEAFAGYAGNAVLVAARVADPLSQ